MVLNFFCILTLCIGLTQLPSSIHDASNLTQPAAKSCQSCPTRCNPIHGSPPGSLVPGILQARTLEWVAISFSNAWKWKVKVRSLSRVRLLATPWTVAYQASPSMEFSRQEYWSGSPVPSPDPACIDTQILCKWDGLKERLQSPQFYTGCTNCFYSQDIICISIYSMRVIISVLL